MPPENDSPDIVPFGSASRDEEPVPEEYGDKPFDSLFEQDYSTWMSESDLAVSQMATSPAATEPPPRLRWCPTHRRREVLNANGEFTCGPAWQELHAMERQAALAKTTTVEVLSTIAEKFEDLINVIAEPLPRPQPSPPPPPPLPPLPLLPPPPPVRHGRGGIALP